MEEERRPETGTEEEARRMSREDVHGYEGITLSEDGNEERREEKTTGNVRFYSVNFSEAPFWKKILWLSLAGVVMAGFFLVAGVFMVGALAVAGVCALVYFLKRAFM